MQNDFTEHSRLLEQYCDFKKLRRALSRSDWENVSAIVRQSVRNLAEAEKTGALAADEPEALTNLLFVMLHYDLFYGLMQRLDCDLEDTAEARDAMCADYADWKESGQPGTRAWLNIFRKRADAAALKTTLFQAIDALCMPVAEFCEYPPAGTVEPKWVRKSIGEFELVTIVDAVITDDGGLWDDPRPNGKNFTMTDADTCVYHLAGVRETTAAHEEMRRVVLPEQGVRSFTAMGWIEGYTGRRRREIEFTLLKDKTAVFSYSTQDVDDSAAESDPRWGGYDAWAQARMDFRRGYIAEFLRQQREDAQ